MKKEQVAAMILGSTEVQEMLYINRSRLAALVTEGKLKPFKQLKNEKLFWLPEVESFKKELLKDTRSNIYKMEVLKNAQ
jgi:hypothetical protein